MRKNYLSRTDIKIILHYLGYIMEGTGIILALPIIIDLIYGEYVYPIGLIPPAISIILGFLFVTAFLKNDRLKLKHGMIISSIAWLWAGFIAALIMMLIIDISFLDAFFENISAWTGSGLTIFNDVESLPMSILFLRSLEQWVGGLGVVIIFISILIKPGTSAYRLYKSEAREDRIQPSIKNTLRRTLEIYLFYTALGIILYILAGMPLFDSINLTFTTISTGGMSIKNANVGYYQNSIIYLITIFIMILGATSFTVHYKMLKTGGKHLFKDIQFQFMIISIMIFTILVIWINGIAPIEAIFHVVSAITTTGADTISSSELASWAPASLLLISVLMVIGGSSGSTVGAVKIVRIITFLRSVNLSVTSIMSPQRTPKTSIRGKQIFEKEMKESSSYIAIYLFFILISWMIMLYFTNDPFNSFFDTVSTIGNVGLSTGVINQGLNPIPKIWLIFLMWIGRLEIIPIILTLKVGLDSFEHALKISKRRLKRKISLKD